MAAAGRRSMRTSPHDVPVALVGEGPPVAGIVGALERDGVFEVKRAKSGSAARKLIARARGLRRVRAAGGRRAPARRGRRVAPRSPTCCARRRGRIDAQARRQDHPDRHQAAARRRIAPGCRGIWLTFVAALVGRAGGLAAGGRSRRACAAAEGRARARRACCSCSRWRAGALMALVATQLDVYPDHFLEVGGALALVTLGAATVSAFAHELAGRGGRGDGGAARCSPVLGALVTSGGASAPGAAARAVDDDRQRAAGAVEHRAHPQPRVLRRRGDHDAADRARRLRARRRRADAGAEPVPEAWAQGLRARHVVAGRRLDLDAVADVDEQRHAERRAGLERRGLVAAARGGVAAQAGLGLR